MSPRRRATGHARWTVAAAGVTGLRRRAASDVGPLLVIGLVLTLAVFLADATPRLLTHVADEAVQAAVAAEPSAGLTVSAPFDGDVVEAVRDPDTADRLVGDAAQVARTLPAPLGTVLGKPSAQVVSTELSAATPAGPAVLRLAFLWRDDFAGVDWVEGRAPGPSTGAGPAGGDDPTWPVRVGLAAPVAALLDVHAGDRVAVSRPDRQPLQVTVSGIFRAREAGDPLWDQVAGLLEPSFRGTGVGRTLALGALLSPESLPDVRLALDPDTISRTITFPVEPRSVRLADLGAVARSASALQSAPTTLGLTGARPTVWTQLDSVARRIQARVGAAGAQASVLLVGVLGAAASVVVLGSWLLVRRRAVVLRRYRARGASLLSVGLGLAVEQLALCVAAATAGLLVSRLLVPGAPSWAWVLPVAAVAVLAAPLLGVVTAARGAARRVQTTDRTRHVDSRQVRRATLQVALVLVAAAALVTLRRRGLPLDPTGADLLLVAGPALTALAVGTLGARAAGALQRGAVGLTARLRGAGPMLASAGGAASRAAVSFAVLTLCTALAAFGTLVAATIASGEVEGSWDTVGADALVRADAGRPLDAVANQVAAAPGVRAVALGHLSDGVQLFGVDGTEWVDVLAVDSAEYARLLAATPLHQPQGLAALGTGTAPSTGARTGPGPATALPVLAGPAVREGGSTPALLWNGRTIPLRPVGAAPALAPALAGPGPRAALVVVDRHALAAATGAPVDADVLWAVGPGAEDAVRSGAPDAAAVTGRATWLEERRHEPLTAGLQLLLRLGTPVLLGLGVVVVVLAAAADAPRRGQTLAVLQVLGLDRRQAGRIAAAEAVPWVLLATLCGLATGGGLAAFCLGPLDLRLVTGQSTDPALTWQWWLLLLVPVLGAAATAVPVLQSRRRSPLGQVMRIGG